MRTLSRENFIGTSDSTGRFKPSIESYGASDNWFWDNNITYQAYQWMTGTKDESAPSDSALTPSNSTDTALAPSSLNEPVPQATPSRSRSTTRPPESSWMDLALPIGAMLGVSGLVYLAWRYLPESK